AALGFPSCLGHGFGFFKDADSHVAPPPDLGTAVGAGDNALIRRMGRDGESIAAALTAFERGSVRIRLDRLRHDTASILVGRTTAAKKPTTVSHTGYAAANRPMKPPSVDHALWQRAD